MREEKNNIEQVFDSMLKEALIDEVDEHFSPLEEDELQHPSDGFKDNMKKMFAKYEREDRIKSFRTFAARAACVFAAVAVVSATAVLGVDAWRIKLLNFFFDPSNPGTNISFNDNGGTTYSDEYVRLGYVPMGFDVTDKVQMRTCNAIHFENGEKYFAFDMSSVESHLTIDTENAVVEDISVNGYKGIYSTNDNVNILLWYDDYNVYSISGNIDKKEIIKIAESTNPFVYFDEN